MATVEKKSGASQTLADQVLTPEAVAFVTELQRKFGPRREELLQNRLLRAQRLNAGELPTFLPETKAIREGDWKIAPEPADIQDRRVEITGPVDRKMMINALNSGARVFMADFEDSCTPTWENVLQGHINLTDAIDGTLAYTSPDGKKQYKLNEKVATLFVRPRGWHLEEKHLLIDGKPAAGGFVDAGLYLFRNAKRLVAKGTAPYFYLPKLESHLEARLWNDFFTYAEEALGLKHGTIKATVLLETILAAFEMDEILYELRDHSAGINAGRWDYLFSMISKFRESAKLLLPDRAQVTMTAPFMRAYTELLVKTCHKRGAHAIGGMAAFIPSRKDPKVNEVALEKVRLDKEREASDGFDGTWVAHPDLVPVATAVFDQIMGQQPNQVTSRPRSEVQVTAEQLLDTNIPGGQITEAGLRNNISVAIQYIESWLRGVGAAAIFNLMEDAATAEISRSQIWQWVRHKACFTGTKTQITPDLVRTLAKEELAKIEAMFGKETFAAGRFDDAYALFEQVALSENFIAFLTLPAYAKID